MEVNNQKIMNKIIYLITTEGCASCDIMEKILHKVQDAFPNKFELLVIDATKISYILKLFEALDDFPTTCIVEDDKEIHRFVGTKSYNDTTSLLIGLNYI